MSHNVSSKNGIFMSLLLLLLLLAFDLKCVNTADEVPAVTESSTTPEPEGTTGCPPPDLKISRPRTKSLTTEQPLLVTFETTQFYLPQDFSTEDLELVNTKKKESDDTSINNSGEQVDRNTQQDAIKVKENPFWFEEIVRDSEQHFHDSESTHHNTHHHRDNTRRAKRNHHKKLKQWRNYDNPVIERVLSRRSIVEEDYANDELVEPTDVIGNIFNENDTCTEFEPSHYSTYNNIMNINDELILEEEKLEDDIKQLAEADEKMDEHEEMENNQKHGKNRVKRKSGKTTSALNRPKSSSDSKSKSSSRKVHGQIDEEGTYMIDSEEEGVVSKEKDKDSEETDEDADHSQFREVSEVRFPAEVGPLGTHRLCKIKCIDSMWVGPLCAAGDQDESGQMKFEPLYKRCVVDQIPPNLLLSYKNVSVTLNWDLPHGHTLQARCADLGLYKLLGEAKVLCSNGLWAPKLPQCVPTTLLTNYSDDSPPSIRIKVGTGSAAYEPSGILAVLPGSTLHLDCMYPRRKGSPEWTWTGWFRQYLTDQLFNPIPNFAIPGWSAVADKNSDEKASRYRLTIKDIQTGDSGTYTCATPRGLTNSISLVVAVSQCPTMNEPPPPLSLRLEGIKLGQRAIYRCPMGYMLQGTENATCLASGNWSSPAPTCIPIQCPPLFLEDPHLSLTELNTSAWGRAVFRCSWGYRLSGPPGLECLASGHWSGPIPRCRAIQCPQPVIPLNGGIDGTSGTAFGQRRYAVGALLTFSCNEAHLLVGEASIVCTESGFWSHAPPFCKAQCVYPGDPPNGLIAPLKFHYDPGDFLTVQCRPGFVEHGQNGQPPDRPKCLSDGNWSSQVSQCKNYEEV